MKRILSLFLVSITVFAFSSCSQFEVLGLDNFSENTCSLGLNDGLLPGDRQFLVDYAYEDGDYIYLYNDDLKQIKAKTFVWIRYSEAVYPQAKSACEDYYRFTSEPYIYGDFIFSTSSFLHKPNEDNSVKIQTFGYNDNTCTLVFLGCYGYELNLNDSITESDFIDFLNNELGSDLFTEEKA